MTQSLHPSHDGSYTVFSEKYNAHYHSVFGAIEESIHVFISAGIFYFHQKGHKNLRIFEMGFGTGLNAYLAYLESSRFNIKIDYKTIESDPIASDIYEALNYSELLDPNSEEKFQKLHSSDWGVTHQISDKFTFTKYHDQIEKHDFDGYYDLIFFDAFAPTCQSHLWEEELHQKLYNNLTSNGALVTYCTKGSFKRMLQSIGYEIEKLNGPAKKREMMRAIKRK